MKKERMVELAQSQLNAYNKRDIEAFCHCYHPQVVVMKLISNQILSRGLPDFKVTYENLFAANPEMHCDLKSRIVGDSSVIDEEWVTGFVKAPEGLNAIAIYGFRDDLIDRVWFMG